MTNDLLRIENLHIHVGDKEIVRGLNLIIHEGEAHAIMGPNGSGKSTLSNAIAGHPAYTISAGRIMFRGENIAALPPHLRARKGLFLSPQHPPSIEGVTVGNFLRTAKSAISSVRQNPVAFHAGLLETMKRISMDPSFATRHINVGFSGGEKKRLEILQLLVLEPAMAILDETDSGLDVDALKTVAEGIQSFRGPSRGVLLITHYNRLLRYVVTDVVHIMKDGMIVKSGGRELADEVEARGYEHT